MKPVKEVLPHREPFLFVDEVVELTETNIIARREVRADEPHFAGHYPGKPIMPGVLLCETLLQAGAYMVATRLGLGADMQGAPVVTRMNKVKFKRMVKPGDMLEIHAEHVRSMMGAHMMTGKILCEGKVACSLEFTVMLVDEA
ncbi:MAG: 3-hydroxyacyl-ACP dehydratase FabZ [Deltaproteobacteria bacterium]